MGSDAPSQEPAARSEPVNLDRVGLNNVEDSLTGLARLAERGILGADGVGITIVRDGVVVGLAASNPFVLAVDAVQYGLSEGPCVTAVADNQTVASPYFRTGEDRWPLFRAGTKGLELGSVVSTPLAVGGQVLGSMNVYAHLPDAFPDSIVGNTEFLASVAALAVSHAYVVSAAGYTATLLHGLIADRGTVDMAVGVLMAEHPGQDRAAAHAILTERAAAQGLDVVTAADRLLADVAPDVPGTK